MGLTNGLDSHVREAKTLPSSDGRQIPAKADTDASLTLSQHSSRPALGLGSANCVKGTRQRLSGFVSIDRQKGLERLRTLVRAASPISG